MRGRLAGLPGADVPEVRDGRSHPDQCRPRDHVRSVQHVRDRCPGDIGATGDVDQLRADVPSGAVGGTVATEHVALLVDAQGFDYRA